MQSWAKRGIQTALVTGGLVMLGTGVASASDNGNPDKPAGPLDLSVSVPVHIKDNVVGTPFGQKKMPEVNQEIKTPSVSDLSSKMPKSKMSDKADKVSSKLNEDAGKVTSKLTDSASQATSKATGKSAESSKSSTQAESKQDMFRGNKIVGNVAVPVEICGNALAGGGKAEATGSCDQSYKHNQDTKTSSNGQSLGGNVVNLDWAAPVQVTGNALGGLAGDAKSDYKASQSTETTGNTETDGDKANGSGNVLAAHPATPIELNGVAGSGLLGSAHTNSTSTNHSKSGGWVKSTGDKGVGSGNVGAVPAALPVEANNIAGSALIGNSEAGTGPEGLAASGGSHDTDARSGATAPNAQGRPMYSQTSGKHSLLGGNVAQPELAGPVQLCGIAAADKIGASHAHCKSTNKSVAGGGTNTWGNKSLGGGNAAHAPISLPVQATGIAGSAEGGITKADSDSKTTSLTGGQVDNDQMAADPVKGNTYTQGDGSAAGGNIISAPLAGAPELCGIGGAFIGIADANCKNDTTAKSGGYDGNTGNDSAVGGNIVQTPLAIPAEVFGVGGTFIGKAAGHGSEKKDVEAGGDTNTKDDNGFGSSNIVSTPGAIPVQVFGVGGSFIGQALGTGDTDTTTKAGGKGHATGDKGGASGNIVTAPLAGPAQVFGIGGTFIGQAAGAGKGKTSTTAGGDNTASGKDGSLAGNVVEAPGGFAVQAFGDAASLIGNSFAKGDNTTDTTAGGTTDANGDGGSGAGNVVAAPLNPIIQAFGVDAHGLGIGSAEAANDTTGKVGGDIVSSGKNGSFAGNVGYLPLQVLGQGFGDALAGGGLANGSAVNSVASKNGGNVTTDGSNGSLAGNIIAGQGQGFGRFFGNGGALFGNATDTAIDSTNLKNGGDLTSNGTNGSGSGNVFDGPGELSPQFFGNGAGILSNVTSTGVDDITAVNGGKDSSSTPDTKAFSGMVHQMPFGVVPEVFNFKLPILSNVLVTAAHNTDVTNGGAKAPSLPFDGSSLPSAPSVPSMPSLPSLPSASALPSLPGKATPALPAMPAAQSAPATQSAPVAQTMPMMNKQSFAATGPLKDAPQLPDANLPSLTQLPGADQLPAMPGVPSAGDLHLFQLDLGNFSELGDKLKGGLPTGTNKLPAMNNIHLSSPTFGALQEATGMRKA